jgi:hypothetical protein
VDVRERGDSIVLVVSYTDEPCGGCKRERGDEKKLLVVSNTDDSKLLVDVGTRESKLVTNKKTNKQTKSGDFSFYRPFTSLSLPSRLPSAL